MNRVILMGRLTRDPDVRYSQGTTATTIARYTLAVERRFKKEGETAAADFISCIAFGRSADFAGQYLHKGMKIAVTGRIQTGSYTNREGNKVYTTDVVVEDHEFAESRATSQENRESYAPATPDHTADTGYGFMDIPEGMDDELPFA